MHNVIDTNKQVSTYLQVVMDKLVPQYPDRVFIVRSPHQLAIHSSGAHEGSADDSACATYIGKVKITTGRSVRGVWRCGYEVCPATSSFPIVRTTVASKVCRAVKGLRVRSAQEALASRVDAARAKVFQERATVGYAMAQQVNLGIDGRDKDNAFLRGVVHAYIARPDVDEGKSLTLQLMLEEREHGVYTMVPTPDGYARFVPGSGLTQVGRESIPEHVLRGAGLLKVVETDPVYLPGVGYKVNGVLFIINKKEQIA